MIIKYLLLVAACLISFSLSAQCCGKKTVDADVQKQETLNAVSASAETNQAKLPKLVDLGAKKCIPCKKMAPILEELTLEYKGIMDVEFIDVWEKENVEKAKQYGIQSIPTQIFFDGNGKEVWRHEGYISKEDILAKWKELGSDMEKMKKEKEQKSK